MRRAAAIALLGALTALCAAAPASAQFGFESVQVEVIGAKGETPPQAGSHPFSLITTLAMNTLPGEAAGTVAPEGALEDLTITTPEGLVADPTAVPRCPTATFIEVVNKQGECPDPTAVGITEVDISYIAKAPSGYEFSPAVYNLPPPPGMVARFGFAVVNVPVIIDIGITSQPPYRGLVRLENISQYALFFGARTAIWGNPSDPAHDDERGACAEEGEGCGVEELDRPLLTLPRSCEGELETGFSARAWNSGKSAFASASSEALAGCERLAFGPRISAQPTNASAEGPTGLDFDLDVADEGLTDPGGLAASDIRAAEVALPEGMTANPSLAEGLTACSPDQLDREALDSAPGEGCPQASKIGTAEVRTPILENTTVRGQLYIATPDDPSRPGAENPFDSLLAFYLVLREPKRGVLVKQAARIEPDPRDGRLITTMEEIPQFPLSEVRLRLREGGRSPLITPPRCGDHAVQALFYPWADPERPLELTERFQITHGVGGGPCPPAGVQPFAPGFAAGTLSPAAGQHSPLSMRLTRRDGDQDITRFSATLPAGLSAKLAGVGWCPEAAIAAARAKSGRAELAAPSCPPSSRLGGVLAGAGVGTELTYARGAIYLAGPHNGAPLSVVGIVPAVAGPFDVGTVVVRQALGVDPRSAVAHIDGSRSDPIPHILAGIPLRVRDIRIEADRPAFTLNPTDCSPKAFSAGLWGGGFDPFASADDVPVTRAAPFQAADCAALGFRPRLGLRLKGGTRRGAHPALRAVFRPRQGDANLKSMVVRLPRSAFLDQGHIRTVCTRVQFAAKACPPGARYGRIRAWTPLLDEPLQGPVWLRSSNNKLPDLVFDLKGLVDIEVSARIDSVRGGIRATIKDAPDAPLSVVVLDMQGGDKGLIVNSRSLCANRSRAGVALGAQNARRHRQATTVRPSCKKRKARRARASHRAR